MKTTTTRNILIALLTFLGLSSIIGGTILIISPSGKLLGGLPLSLLKNSLFENFLFPGLILFFVLGVTSCVISIALLKQSKCAFAEKLNIFNDLHWAWSFSIYTAFALIIWIQVETIIFQSSGWLQSFFMLYSILIIMVALLPVSRMMYKK
jgi:hypothetical protein